MESDLKTILLVGDMPNCIGYKLILRFLEAGYNVKAPGCFVIEEDIKGVVLRNKKFLEIEYNPYDEKKLKEIISGCFAVMYFDSSVCDNNLEINSNFDELDKIKITKIISNISKNCRVHHFVYGLIPVVFGDEVELNKNEEVQFKKLNDYFKKIAVDQFIITTLQPCSNANVFNRQKLDLKISIIRNRTINTRKARLYDDCKKQIFSISAIQLTENCEWGESHGYEFHVKGIFDLCRFILEYYDNDKKKKWVSQILFQLYLDHFYFFRHLVRYARNPRIPFWGRIVSIAIAIHRTFDVAMMMFLLHVWPEQVYRFSTRKLLPKKSERFNAKERSVIPFDLIESKTNNMKRMKKINIIMRGKSFNISDLDNLEGPTFLVNFDNFVENYDNNINLTKINEGVTYMSGKIGSLYRLTKLDHLVCHVEVSRVAENGKTFPPDGYSDISWYEKLPDNPNFSRISIAEKICRPYKLPLPSSWRPAGAGLNSLCALLYFADKINIYGWDYYLESSPEDMTYWQLFFNLNKFSLDVFRSKLHFECGLINFYFAYHLSRLSRIKNYGFLGKLNSHEKLIRKIERVLYN